jgi:hypothetical protein
MDLEEEALRLSLIKKAIPRFSRALWKKLFRSFLIRHGEHYDLEIHLIDERWYYCPRSDSVVAEGEL